MEEEITIEYYETENGISPYLEWEAELPKEIRAQVRKRINRVRLGVFGDHEQIKGTVPIFELRIHIGPGYRIYCGKKGKRIVVLLCGGKKGSQKRDITRAEKYWLDCLK